MKYDVFISYSREDYVNENKNIIPENVITKIKSFLANHGYTYWFDEDGIYSGDAFVEIITEAIQDSEIFLFVSTKSSNESKWTNHEIATAKLLGKKIIPFRVDNTIYNKSILMYLAPLDYIDYAKNPNKSFDALLSSLKHHYDRIREKELKQKEEENRRLIEIEKENKLREAEAARQQKLRGIENEITKIQQSIDKCDSDKRSLEENIDSLKKQIISCECELNTVNNNRKALCSSIHLLEQEKQSLLGIKKILVEEKKGTKFNLFVHIKKRINNILYKFRNLNCKNKENERFKKRYCFHFLILLYLSLVVLRILWAFYELLFFPLLWNIISIGGIILLLKGKKDGMLILLLNSILFYFCMYIQGEYIWKGYPYLILYLSFVLLIYWLHKSDEDSHLSWNKMQKMCLNHPKRVMIWIVGVFGVLSMGIPYAYAKYCHIKNYTVLYANNLTMRSLRGLLGDDWSAEMMGDYYMNSGYYNDMLERDVYRARWWYEVAKDQNGIALCNQYIDAMRYGYYVSDVYGKCGLNKKTGRLVKISIDSWGKYTDAVLENDETITCGDSYPYSGDSILSDKEYKISLKGADLSQGELEVEGAQFVESVQAITNIQGDSVILKFIQEQDVVAKRVVPVIKVEGKPVKRYKLYFDNNSEKKKNRKSDLYKKKYDR